MLQLCKIRRRAPLREPPPTDGSDRMTEHQTVLILDFGGQYNQLIARRVRELGVYCEVHPCHRAMEKLAQLRPIGVIFTGGPNSVYLPDSPRVDPALFRQGVPVLGICYGIQTMAHLLGGHVTTPENQEYGRTDTWYDTDSLLFQGLPDRGISWMSHTDYVDRLPEGFRATAHTATTPVAAMECREKGFYGLQFHPEVLHTENGCAMLRNFLYRVCGAVGDWTMEDFARTAVERLRERIGDKRVMLALSGGVDSSVCAALLAKAVGEQLTAIFVDTGLMRKNEGDEVEAAFAGMPIRLIRVNAAGRFLDRLRGVEDPEAKRKIIGEEFIRVFEEEAKKIGAVDFLAQGTIYPDVIESGTGNAATIKSHHNVGGLPDHVEFREILEPLRLLFKDETRALGLELGLPEYLVWRQPFPGPGLGVRVLGEVTAEKVGILQEADAIFREEIARAGLDREVSQYFAVLTGTRSVGVMGDSRTYDYTLALRGVTTTDFMTADWARIPYDVLERCSGRIVNEVRGVNRVVYDITSKPPGTIEWE